MKTLFAGAAALAVMTMFGAATAEAAVAARCGPRGCAAVRTGPRYVRPAPRGVYVAPRAPVRCYYRAGVRVCR